MGINLFKDAKFGDHFITRDGRVGIYTGISGRNQAMVIFENHGGADYYDLDGNLHNKSCGSQYPIPHDIISKYSDDKHN